MNPNPNLLQTFEQLLHGWESLFPQYRTFVRARRLTFGLLVCLRQHLTSNAICALGRQGEDWSADYRVLSRSPWDPQRLFAPIFDGLRRFLKPDNAPLLVALDDTSCKKTGRKIPGVNTLRDPLSPPFRVNLHRALRFVQGSFLVLPASPGPARALPLRFEPAPLPVKPKKKDSAELKELYRQQKKLRCLSQVGVNLLHSVRQQFDLAADTAKRQLLALVDGSYTNKTVLTQLPPRTTLIGRIRKDAKLKQPLPPALAKGNRRYGPPAPTPEQVLKDPSFPFVTVKVFAAGKLRELAVKTLAPLFWSRAGHLQPLRLVVIKPLGYRLSNQSKLLYRDPAFLICTDINLPLLDLVQAYVYRWEIECNHRDEKSYIGVAEGQVRSPQAVTRLPQFQVAGYSLLLLASLLAHGFERGDQFLPLPKWRNQPPLRPSILDHLNLLRAQLFEQALPASQSSPHFASSSPSDANGPHFHITPTNLVFPTC